MGSKHTSSSTSKGGGIAANRGATSTSGVLQVRKAYHAGSWYSDDHDELNHMLTSFLSSAHQELSSNDNNNNCNNSIPRAIISPHAGFSYSGPTAAYAYAALHEALTARYNTYNVAHSHTNTQQKPLTIVVLHPSHHVYLDNACALSSVDVLDTPLGRLQVAHDLREELLSSGHFTTMNRSVDEAEHSGEMQYPFIAKVVHDVMQNYEGGFVGNGSVSVLPIMVGSLRTEKERFFGKVLAPVLARKDIFCIVSSDFCHWGNRFGYSPWQDKSIEIYEYIEWLDRGGMDHISLQDPGAFATYLKKYKNTICGRNPIGKLSYLFVVYYLSGFDLMPLWLIRLDDGPFSLICACRN